MSGSKIYFIEKNIHGAWAVWGVIGIRQYYYYTKKQARELYLKEVAETCVFNS